MSSNPPANRWRRLFATGIDLLLFLVGAMIVTLVSGLLERAEAWEYQQLIPRVALIIFITYLLVHGPALYKYGHTLGKHWLKLRIVSSQTNQRLPFWKLLWLRGPFLPMLLLLAAGPLAVLPLLDSLLIFTRSKRCGHDYVAASQVVGTAIRTPAQAAQ